MSMQQAAMAAAVGATIMTGGAAAPALAGAGGAGAAGAGAGAAAAGATGMTAAEVAAAEALAATTAETAATTGVVGATGGTTGGGALGMSTGGTNGLGMTFEGLGSGVGGSGSVSGGSLIPSSTAAPTQGIMGTNMVAPNAGGTLSTSESLAGGFESLAGEGVSNGTGLNLATGGGQTQLGVAADPNSLAGGFEGMGTAEPGYFENLARSPGEYWDGVKQDYNALTDFSGDTSLMEKGKILTNRGSGIMANEANEQSYQAESDARNQQMQKQMAIANQQQRDWMTKNSGINMDTGQMSGIM